MKLVAGCPITVMMETFHRFVKSFSRNEIFILCTYVVATLLLGALLAPPIFHGCKWLITTGAFAGAMESKSGFLYSIGHALERSEFPRYFNRAMLIAALICLWPAIRLLKIRRSDLGLVPNPRWLEHLFVGLLASAGLLLAMGYVFVGIGYYVDKVQLSSGVLTSIIVSAVVVALLEEFFFRAGILALVMRTVSPMKALIFVSAFFAIIHFLQPSPELRQELEKADYDVGLGSGFWLIGQIFAKFGNPVFLVAEFATLFAVGLVLGYTRLKTSSLWLAIGLHAGWVFGIKFYAVMTKRGEQGFASLAWR